MSICILAVRERSATEIYINGINSIAVLLIHVEDELLRCRAFRETFSLQVLLFSSLILVFHDQCFAINIAERNINCIFVIRFVAVNLFGHTDYDVVYHRCAREGRKRNVMHLARIGRSELIIQQMSGASIGRYAIRNSHFMSLFVQVRAIRELLVRIAIHPNIQIAILIRVNDGELQVH